MLNHLLQPLDLIMEDGPAATGPEEHSSSSVCIACCKDLSGRVECHRYTQFDEHGTAQIIDIVPLRIH